MDFKHLSKTLTFFFVLFNISQSFTQFGGPGGGSNFSIWGSSTVSVGESHSYNISGDTQNIFNSIFHSDSGTVISSTLTYCVINFTTSGSSFVAAEVQDYLGSYYLVFKDVTVLAGLNAGSITGSDTICYSGDPNNLSNVTLASGGSGGYAYQWQWSSSSGTSGFTNINGATDTSYNPPSGLTTTRYYRRRVISNGLTSYTDPEVINVRSPLTAGSIGTPNEVCVGGDPDTLTNSSSPSGGDGNYSYQWEISTYGSPWTNILGATNASYDPPSGVSGGVEYRRRVSSCGQSISTSAISLVLFAEVSQPQVSNPDPLCGSGSVTLIATPGIGGDRIRWYDNSSGGAVLHTGTDYTVSLTTTKTYYVESYKESTGCKSIVREPITVTVYPPLAGGTIVTIPNAICYNTAPSALSSVSLATGCSGSYAYQWESAAVSGGWSLITGATNVSYNPPALTSTRLYRRRVISNGKTAYSNTSTITVNTPLTAGSISAPSPVCYGGDPASLGNTTNPTGGNGSYAYQWEFLNTVSVWTIISGATDPTYNPPSGLVTNTQYRRKVSSCGQTTTSNAVTIVVNGQVLTAGGVEASRCGSGSVALTASPGTNANTIRWYSALIGGAPLSTNTTFNTPSISTTTTYYAESYNSDTGCFASTRHAIQAIVNSTTIYYHDADGDGYGDPTDFESACLAPPNHVSNNLDCNDNNANINPNTIWYADADGDGYGNLNSTTTSCTQPVSYVSNGIDYDDTTTNITNIQPQYFYQDIDGDGFGDPANSLYYSVQPVGYVLNNTDNCPNEAGANNGCGYTPPTFSDQNYVYTRAYQSAMANATGIVENKDVIESIAYFDGLGRPMQSVNIKASPSKQDIINHVDYDPYGRQVKDYLPYQTTTGAVGSYRTDAATATNNYYQANYGTDLNTSYLNPFSEKEFEASPLNRVKKQAAPGYDWRKGSGHEIEFEYQTNITNEVRLYNVTTSFANSTYTPSLVANGHYSAGELYKNITKDENHPGTTTKNHTTEEFIDKQGRVVLKRTYSDVSGTPQAAHDTYYVYDDFGNLTYVLPPKVITADGVSTTELNELCYQYKYDTRNRLVEKKIPGKGSATNWEEIVYNKLDQPILTRDPNLKAQNKWLFTKYDAFGRVAYTGMVTGGTRTIHQTAANAVTTSWVNQATTATSIGGTLVYYNNGGYPTSNISEVHTINYYDTYIDAAGLSVPSTIQTQPKATNTKGLATVSKIRVLTTNNWITSITGYDQKGRAIYIASDNTYLGTSDIAETLLDFPGKVMYSKSTHIKGASTPIVVEDHFSYDHMGRLLKQEQEINGGTTTVIADNTYDNLGQLVQKKVGGNLQTVDYSYNIRGWLKQINDPANIGTDLFAFKINYNTPTHGATQLFNGNISETEWRTANTDNSLKWYRYSYDPLNRITAATGNTSNYNLSNVSYDKMGNITLLNRNGHTNTVATTFGVMDSLVYTYNSGNKLTKVLDNGNDTFGFKDSSANNQDYWYDVNGNMTRDLNKGIGTTSANGIAYNHLNLPTEVKFDNSSTKKINYIYDAVGTKQKKIVTSGGSLTTTEYAGNYIYEGTTLQFFNHAEGYNTPNGQGGYDYIYQFKDHLGNIRLSYQDANKDGQITVSTNPNLTEIVKESNYYPFGLQHKGYNGSTNSLGNSVAKKFEYNGIEFNESLDLDIYETYARGYDPALGRFIQIDPLGELIQQIDKSPYNFAWNNPVYFNDPTGLCPDCPDPSGAKQDDIYTITNGSEYIFNNSEWERHTVVELDEVVVTSNTEISDDGFEGRKDQLAISLILGGSTTNGIFAELTIGAEIAGAGSAVGTGAAIAAPVLLMSLPLLYISYQPIAPPVYFPESGTISTLRSYQIKPTIEPLTIPEMPPVGYQPFTAAEALAVSAYIDQMAKSKKGKASQRQEDVQHGNQGNGKLSGAKKTAHQKRRTGDLGDKKRQPPPRGSGRRPWKQQ